MELKALWRMFLRRWWIIVLPTVIVAAVTVPQILTPPGGGFTTSVHLTAAQPPTGDELSYEDQSFVPWTASEYLVNGLTDWVRTHTFKEEVSAKLAADGVVIPANALYGSFAADNARSVIVLVASWHDAEQLTAIVEAAIAVLQDYNQDYFPQLAAEPATVTALDTVVVYATAPSMMNRLKPLVKVALALLVGLGLAALFEYLDDSIYNRRDVELADLAVLGEIPRHKESFR
ncbi:hypothetical protein ACFLYO_09420 [Chloroflexota bacterium]